MTDEFRASLYAFNLVNRAGKRTLAAAETEPIPIMKAGIVGAGLMASQLARVLAQNLEIEVVMRDLDSERVTAGLDAVHHELQADVDGGRLAASRAEEIRDRVQGTTDISEFGDCQLIIEAVTEKMSIKRAVFSEQIGRASCRERVENTGGSGALKRKKEKNRGESTHAAEQH